MPFGGGNRRCIGMAFALFEMKMVLATVLSDWEMTVSEAVQPVRKGALLGASKGVPMVIRGKRAKSQRVTEFANTL